MASLLLFQPAMVARALSATLVGIDARLIEVEAELSVGLPSFSVIGLGGTSVQEARYRIQSALRAADIKIPHKRITINLAPASLRKEGAALDLPMAMSLLAALEVIPPRLVTESVALGELSLSGHLRPVRGVFAVAAMVSEKKLARLIVPRTNAREALAIPGLEVVAANDLAGLIAHLRGEHPLPSLALAETSREETTEEAELDMGDIRGQSVGRRALEIAAAGGHNLLLVGSPGSGKTMLARRLPSILPPLTASEQVEVTRVWSVAGLTIGASELISRRPFRAPHHTISEAGLIGGGHPVRPGEISLAHHGVLFLDEMPEAPRRVLECLRQPLEDRAVSIVRARQSVRLPAAFTLVGAANPCPCGWRGHRTRACTCRNEDVKRYAARISGPLLDRMDLVVDAPALSAGEMMSEGRGESSAIIRARVVTARRAAQQRAGVQNAMLAGQPLRHAAELETEAHSLLVAAIERLDLSARSIDRTLRVARTIADLAGSPKVDRAAVAEALSYRETNLLRTSCATSEVDALRREPPGRRSRVALRRVAARGRPRPTAPTA